MTSELYPSQIEYTSFILYLMQKSLRFYETSTNKKLSYWCTLPVFKLGYIALIFMKLESRNLKVIRMYFLIVGILKYNEKMVINQIYDFINVMTCFD